MKKSILIILISFNLLAQKRTEIFFNDFVECYYPNNLKKSIPIYNSVNGELVAELKVLTESHCWYKFAISESKDGWLKIENIIVLPACEKNELNKDIGKYKGKWVLSKNMAIDLPYNGFGKNTFIEYKFYDKPYEDSKIIFKTKKPIRTYLVDVFGTWAKLKFKIEGKEYIGWLERKYQCPYPWTNCPVYD